MLKLNMNKKITFPDLINLVAVATDSSKRISEVFLKELFATIAKELADGETVSINGLGSFSLTDVNSRKSINVNTGEEIEIPSHRKVIFTPDKSISELINAPFAEFESVILDDDFNEDAFEQDDEQNAPQSEKEEVGEEVVIKEEKPLVLPPPFTKKIVKTEPEPQPQEETQNSEEGTISDKQPAEQVVASELSNDSEANNDNSYASDFFDEEKSFWEEYKTLILSLIIFIVLFGAGIAGWYFYCANKFAVETMLPNQAKSEIVAADSVITANADSIKTTLANDSVKQEPVKSLTKSVITDTVTRTMFLTKLSRKHYGDYHFWVYIYEENKDKISNPNAVAPGTVVVIPDASKYGIDKNNPVSIAKAQQKAEKILGK